MQSPTSTLSIANLARRLNLQLFNPPRGSIIPYSIDLPWYIGVYGALLLEYPIRKIKRNESATLPNSFSIWLIFALLYIPATVAMARLLRPPGNITLFQDLREIVFMLACPVIAAVMFSFYKQTFRTFSALQSDNIVTECKTGAFEGIESRISRRSNNFWLLPPFLVVSIFIAIGFDIKTGDDRWYVGSSVGMRAWFAFWVAMVWLALLFFIVKGIIVWLEIRRLAKSDEFIWDLRSDHPDHIGGLKPIWSLWLRVYFITLTLGFYLMGYFAIDTMSNDREILSNFSEIISFPLVIPIALYIIVAPILLVGALFDIHTKMKQYKDQKVHEAFEDLRTAEKDVEDSRDNDLDTKGDLLRAAEYQRNRYEAVVKLPEWPILGPKIFFLTYLFPILIALITELFENQIN